MQERRKGPLGRLQHLQHCHLAQHFALNFHWFLFTCWKFADVGSLKGEWSFSLPSLKTCLAVLLCHGWKVQLKMEEGRQRLAGAKSKLLTWKRFLEKLTKTPPAFFVLWVSKWKPIFQVTKMFGQISCFRLVTSQLRENSSPGTTWKGAF